MFELRPISADGVPSALEKADRYRLLNEPREAESICRDIIAVQPGNQEALRALLLALTDQFFMRNNVTVKDAQAVHDQLTGDAHRAYFAGVIAERWAKHLLDCGYSKQEVLRSLRQAMSHYDDAERLVEPGNDDPRLRWNACVRIIEREALIEEADDRLDEEVEHWDNEVPTR